MKERLKILLVNEVEDAEGLALTCGMLKIHEAHVTARLPVFDYITKFLASSPQKYVFVACENKHDGFYIAHTLATGFPNQLVILIDEHQGHHTYYPKNLHIFKTIDEGVKYIKASTT